MQDNMRTGGEGEHFDSLNKSAADHAAAIEYAADCFTRELNARGAFGKVRDPDSEVDAKLLITDVVRDSFFAADGDQILTMMVAVVEAASRGLCLSVEAKNALDAVRNQYARAAA